MAVGRSRAAAAQPVNKTAFESSIPGRLAPPRDLKSQTFSAPVNVCHTPSTTMIPQ
jgi:hypothetical protein